MREERVNGSEATAMADGLNCCEVEVLELCYVGWRSIAPAELVLNPCTEKVLISKFLPSVDKFMDPVPDHNNFNKPLNRPKRLLVISNSQRDLITLVSEYPKILSRIHISTYCQGIATF